MPRLASAALLLALLTAGCGVGGGASIEGPVTVYVSLPLTGPRGPSGQDAEDGARLALQEARGKAGSITVKTTYLDDAKGKSWDPVAVGENARRAVQDSSAAAYIGELDSEPTRASVPITNEAGLVQVSPGAGGIDLTQPAAGYPDSPDRYQPSGSANFARTVPSDDVVTDAAAQFASDLGATAALIQFDGSAFQQLATSDFKGAAVAHGIQTVPGRAADLDPNLGTEVAYDVGTQTLTLAGKPPKVFSVSAELDPSRLPQKNFPSRFAARFHRPAGPYAAYGYEAMALVLQAIDGAGTDASSFRDHVRNNVFGAHRDDTVLGSYAITSEGDTTECMIQRYRVEGTRRLPLGAPCPTK